MPYGPAWPWGAPGTVYIYISGSPGSGGRRNNQSPFRAISRAFGRSMPAADIKSALRRPLTEDVGARLTQGRTLLPLCCQLARLTTPVGRCGCCLLSAERDTHRDRRALAIARERYIITTPTCFAVPGPTCGRELEAAHAARGIVYYAHEIILCICICI